MPRFCADDLSSVSVTLAVSSSVSSSVIVPRRYVGRYFCHPGKIAALKNAWFGCCMARATSLPSASVCTGAPGLITTMLFSPGISSVATFPVASSVMSAHQTFFSSCSVRSVQYFFSFVSFVFSSISKSTFNCNG